MSRTAVLLPLAALLLTGCATRNPCIGDTSYQQAGTLPPPVTVDGLKMPESASALRIPAPPPAAAPAEGECLQTPPRLAETPAPADKAAPVKDSKQAKP